MNFSFNIRKFTEDFKEIESDNGISIFEENIFSPLSQNTFYSRNPSNLTLVIAYFDIFGGNLNESDSLFYMLNITYSGYKIDHQNKKIPLEKK